MRIVALCGVLDHYSKKPSHLSSHDGEAKFTNESY